MSKVTKKERIKELERQVRGLTVLFSSLNTWSEYADNMLTELNHALPDPEYDAKCKENAVAVEESLARHAVRLGLKKPQLKQLDQSVFDGLDEKWKFAAVDADGKAHRCNLHVKPLYEKGEFWRGCTFPPLEFELIGEGYDASNWQNSLIERDIAKELTGSDLALELLKNQRYIIASVSDVSDADAIECGNNKLIHKSSEDIFTDDMGGIYCWAVALDNQGEPLTAAEAGL